jgi:hypothetical protein
MRSFLLCICFLLIGCAIVQSQNILGTWNVTKIIFNNDTLDLKNNEKARVAFIKMYKNKNHNDLMIDTIDVTNREQAFIVSIREEKKKRERIDSINIDKKFIEFINPLQGRYLKIKDDNVYETDYFNFKKESNWYSYDLNTMIIVFKNKETNRNKSFFLFSNKNNNTLFLIDNGSQMITILEK